MQTPRILWFALLMATFIYAAVGFVVAPKDLTIDPTILVVLGVLAIGTGTGAFVMGGMLRRQGYAGAQFEVEEVPDPNAETMFRDSPPTVRRFANPERVRSRLAALSFTPFILELALSEAVAIFGLVAAMLGAEPMTWLPFTALGAILIAIRFPTERRFVRALERVYDARMP